MGVPKKRTSKMRRNRRRAANNKLAGGPVQVIACANCGTAVMPHRVCAACGYYDGKKVKAGRDD